MPELPEVEVVRLRLCDVVLHRKIAEVRTNQANYAFLTPPARLQAKLRNRSFLDIQRQGKYLLFSLDDESRLLVHLGMTGQLFTSRALSPRLFNQQSRPFRSGEAVPNFVPDKHTHLSLRFADRGEQLHFRDCRKFGKVLWLAPGQTDARLERLGVDALSITPQSLGESLTKRRISIKSLLLDQSVLAGVGNIYADEALYQSRLAPNRPALSLSQEEIRLLSKTVRKVLKRAILLGGSTIDDYVHPDGSEGQFQKSFSVYGREGEACHRCKGSIARIVIGQRSSHYCPGCQR
jgi:formamidopyrimidine-DNA glycosylase